MTIAEPTTFVTDCLLAAFSFWLASGLLREAYRLKDRSVTLWLAAFCTVATAGIAGGIWHAFSPGMDPRVAALTWTVSMILGITASLLFLLSILRVYTTGRLLGILDGVAVAKFALFAMWVALSENFRLVVYDSALTMLIIVVLSTWGAWTRQLPSAPWVLIGVMASMLAELFQQGRVSIHPNFNHNDLYHVIQMAAMYFLYRGGLLLRERERTVPDFEATQPLPIVGEE